LIGHPEIVSVTMARKTESRRRANACCRFIETG
jgi:hypothetical protein